MASHALAVNDTSIPGGVESIVKCLPENGKIKPGDTIDVSFDSRGFVYLTGLVLLASWRKSLPADVVTHIEDSGCLAGTRNLLTNSGFREIMETGHEMPSVQKRLGRLPLRPLTNRFNKDATVQDVTSLLDEYAGHVKDTKPFATMLSELCENVLAHSESTSPGYVGARVMEGSLRKIEIAICDSGIGFRGSFLAGTNENAKARVLKGASPIDVALEGLNSSKPTPVRGSYLSYYGFGLFVIRRLVEENRGTMTIISGSEMLALDRMGRKHTGLAKEFSGTFIGIVLDLDNPLPLEEIYTQATESYVGLNKQLPTKPSSTPILVSSSTKESRLKSSNSTESVRMTATEPSPNQVKKNEESTPETSTTMAAVLELKHFGTELLTREAGLAIRAELATRLLIAEKITVQLDGISDITPSVADEAFAKLAERLGSEGFTEVVKFEGGTTLIHRLISFVIKTRTR